MTVGTANVDGEQRAGYASLFGEMGSITEDSFEFDGVAAEVNTLVRCAGQLFLVLGPVPTGDYVLKVGADSFNSADGTLSTSGVTMTWAAASLAWTEGQQVAVELRSTSEAGEPEPAPTPTMTPTPTAEPESTPDDQAPINLTALIVIARVVGEEDSATQVALNWTAPEESADSVTGYEILRSPRGQPDNSRYAIPIATVGSNSFTYVHGDSDGIPRPNLPTALISATTSPPSPGTGTVSRPRCS